jgi:hypothetical protein
MTDSVSRSLFNLIDEGMTLGMVLFESLTGFSMRDRRSSKSVHDRFRGACGEIPPPCWVPRDLGNCVSRVCPCSTASLRLVMINCDAMSRRMVTVEAAGYAKVSPSGVAIGPLERATIELSVSVPADAKAGETLESLVRIHGCREYFLRWKVIVGALGRSSCHEIHVEDCPDLLHHWYDHFYCPRPCPHSGVVVKNDH